MTGTRLENLQLAWGCTHLHPRNELSLSTPSKREFETSVQMGADATTNRVDISTFKADYLGRIERAVLAARINPPRPRRYSYRAGSNGALNSKRFHVVAKTERDDLRPLFDAEPTTEDADPPRPVRFFPGVPECGRARRRIPLVVDRNTRLTVKG